VHWKKSFINKTCTEKNSSIHNAFFSCILVRIGHCPVSRAQVERKIVKNSAFGLAIFVAMTLHTDYPPMNSEGGKQMWLGSGGVE
jgi:hypothetical protein